MISEQKLQILYVLKILREETDENEGISAIAIAEMLSGYGIEAERKSIYGDIDTLKQFGYDIECKRGGDGGFRLKSRELELTELRLLVDAVQASKFITEKKSASLIKKLEGFASKRNGAELQRSVIMRERIKTMNESVFNGVDAIHIAINRKKQIAFQYFDWNVKKERVLRHGGAYYTVSPLALTWDDENYYLVAFDENAGSNKHFRVDKMQNIRIKDATSTAQKNNLRFDTASYSKKMFGMYGGEATKIKLRCANELAGVIIDRFGSNVIIAPDGDFFEVVIEAAVSPVFLGWVIQFGGKIKVLSPESVKARLCEMAQATLAIYK